MNQGLNHRPDLWQAEKNAVVYGLLSGFCRRCAVATRQFDAVDDAPCQPDSQQAKQDAAHGLTDQDALRAPIAAQPQGKGHGAKGVAAQFTMVDWNAAPRLLHSAFATKIMPLKKNSSDSGPQNR